MTAPSNDNSELMDLLGALWDDRLDDASRERLEELLATQGLPAIELLTSFTRLHLDLEWLISSRSAHDKAIASLKSFRNVTFVGEGERRWRRWGARGLAGIAAGILIAVLGVWYFSRPGIDQLTRAPQPVGRVVRLENEVWQSGGQLRTDDAVREGQIVDLKRGFAQISLGFGADILLEGPCRATLLSTDRVALEQGRLGVRAAKWATGFKVETEDVVATDLGTWFSVQSGGSSPAEIHVLEGAVLASPVNKNTAPEATRRVNADEALHVTRDGAFQAIGFRREAAAERLTQFQPLRPIEIWNTGIGIREGDRDAHWMATEGDEQDGPYPLPAVVSVPHPSHGINEPERSQWISVYRGTTRGVPARSRYTFETTFDLTGFDVNSVWVSGLILADDGVDEVRLNGKRLEIKPWTDWYYGANYTKFHPIAIRSGFVSGTNRLAFIVKNETFIEPSKRGFDFPDTPNPMALRAEWQAFGRPTGGAK
jgi:hypothetical protein